MIEACGDPCLTAETINKVRILFREMLGQDFQGHIDIQPFVMALVDRAHAAFAELGQQLVVANSLVGQWVGV